MAIHHLPATSETVHFGFFSADIPPALHVRSGDVVRIETSSGGLEIVESASLPIGDAHARILREHPQKHGPHILTGPIYVEGVEPGHILAIEFLSIAPAVEWGWTRIRPGKGVPTWSKAPFVARAIIDTEGGRVTYPWGLSVPLAPFFGVVGVAPADPGVVEHSGPPGRHGGNLDNRYLTAGTTLYLEALRPGGLVSMGDGHAAQGDGEVGGTAVETALSAEVRVGIAREPHCESLMAETPTDWIMMSVENTIELALRALAVRVIEWLQRHCGLSEEEAAISSSVAIDFRICQLVNGTISAYALIPKNSFALRS